MARSERKKLIEEIESPRRAGFHRRARRFRLRLAYLTSFAVSRLLLERHLPVNYGVDVLRWLLDWHAAGRPPVALSPTVERERYWLYLS